MRSKFLISNYNIFDCMLTSETTIKFQINLTSEAFLTNFFCERLFSSAQVHSENRELSQKLILHGIVCGLIQYVRPHQSKQTNKKNYGKQTSICIFTRLSKSSLYYFSVWDLENTNIRKCISFVTPQSGTTQIPPGFIFALL